MIPGLAEAAGSGFGSVLGYFGNRETNRMNQDISREATAANRASAREAMAFEDAQAKEQMKFQERMSSSAISRMKTDLKNAGLNPLLAISNPASTPSGASGSGSTAQAATATMGNVFEGASGAARDVASFLMQGRKQTEELKLLEAQRNNVNMDTTVKAKGIPEAEIKNNMFDAAKQVLKKLDDAYRSSAPKLFKPGQKNFQEEKRLP